MNILPNTKTSVACSPVAGVLFARGRQTGRHPVSVFTLLVTLVVWLPAALAQPPAPGGSGSVPGQTGASPADVEEERAPSAPVLVGGEPVIWIIAGIGPYTPEFRAERISNRLGAIVSDRSLRDPKVEVVDALGSLELRVGQRLVMVVTENDANATGISRARLAQEYARQLEAAIRNERRRYSPSALVRAGAYAALSTIALLAILWAVRGLTRRLRRRLRQSQWVASQRLQKLQIVSADRLARTIDHFIFAIRVVVILVVIDLYLTYALGLFPWTRALSRTLLDYLLVPLRSAGTAFAGYLPKLMFVIVITAIVYLAIRLVGFFFSQVQSERIVFADFPPEWADPTNKIIRVLLIAFGVVVAFPYLPASGSPAFAGVSVFMGILISLASSSSLSNMIAGLVLTYTGAFRKGDRVRIGDAYGDIHKTSLLATCIRTIKNEEITIPNSIVLGSSVVNFSPKRPAAGLILHTSVTIGYDAPWRKVHELLIRAAVETPGILPEPKPFVWQTALNDFYVTYELNAHTDKPHDIDNTYAVLHARIQDSFYEAGVEIMSPHYTSLRDGNTVAIPEELRSPGYRPRGFQVDSRPPKTE